MRQAILGFISRLREAGVRISMAESLDAARAVVASGLERTRMREALAATLVKDEADRPTFDREFDLYFSAARPPHNDTRRGQSWQGMVGQHARPSESGAQPPARKPAEPVSREKSIKEPAPDQHGDKTAARQPDEESGAVADPAESPGEDQARAAAARNREAETKPFSAYTDLDYEQALKTLEPLKRRFRVRVGRRRRMARRGRVDIRRTIRASIQRGGALIDLRMRRRRPRHVDLLLLADISGSVRYASNLMLGLAAGARECFRTVHSLVYVDCLAEAGFERGYLNMAPMLDLYARSDFGRVMAQLLATRRQLLNRATLVVILGDGRNNRRPARADLLRQIRRLCRAVVWLNPEEPERWGTGDSAIPAYGREVDELIACRNLRELEKSLSRVA
ncbi:MAG TPA: VWA domain-containing protein [Candidatus Binataceae bacterium]